MDREFLKQYKDLYLEIRELKAEIDDMEQHMLPEDADAVTADSLCGMLKDNVKRLTEARREIESSFQCLSALERRLMRKKYLQGKANRVVAAELLMSVDNVKRLHTAALKKIIGDDRL